MAGTDARLHVAAEALDVVMDLYKDDVTDRLAFECSLVTRLRLVFNYFSARYKKEKKACEQRPLLSTVMENMPRFLKYKEPRVLNVDPQKKHAMKDDTNKTKSKTSASVPRGKNKKARRN